MFTISINSISNPVTKLVNTHTQNAVLVLSAWTMWDVSERMTADVPAKLLRRVDSQRRVWLPLNVVAREDSVPGARVSALGWESLLNLMYEAWLSRARGGNFRSDGIATLRCRPWLSPRQRRWVSQGARVHIARFSRNAALWNRDILFECGTNSC